MNKTVIELGNATANENGIYTRTRNSWAINSEQGSKQQGNRKIIRLLGQESNISEFLKWRIKWGQRGASLFALLSLIFYIASDETNFSLQRLKIKSRNL